MHLERYAGVLYLRLIKGRKIILENDSSPCCMHKELKTGVPTYE